MLSHKGLLPYGLWGTSVFQLVRVRRKGERQASDRKQTLLRIQEHWDKPRFLGVWSERSGAECSVGCFGGCAEALPWPWVVVVGEGRDGQ